jgi:NAD(P)-dependent dehydrogenase (short-subunit alcohol dehydrogenase family)
VTDLCQNVEELFLLQVCRVPLQHGRPAFDVVFAASKPAPIQSAAATVAADYGRLHVLVNNAGIADRADGPPSKTSIDAVVRRIFGTRESPHAANRVTVGTSRDREGNSKTGAACLDVQTMQRDSPTGVRHAASRVFIVE